MSNIVMSMQVCEGTVTTLHLYQGAFVDIGGVHEGYVYVSLLCKDRLTVVLVFRVYNVI